MDKFLFVRPLLELLGQGRFFHRALSLIVRALAALAVLFSLTPFFQAGKLIFDLPANGILGGVFFEALLVLAVYSVVHVLLIRAGEIDRLDSGEYYALRAAPVLVRMAGEAYACFVSLVAVGAGIFVWFTGLSQAKVLNPFMLALIPSVRDNPSFMGGIEFMLGGILVAIGALLLSYLLAELLGWLVKLTGRETATATNGRHAAESPAYKSRFGS
jgi:hypothetical protein